MRETKRRSDKAKERQEFEALTEMDKEKAIHASEEYWAKQARLDKECDDRYQRFMKKCESRRVSKEENDGRLWAQLRRLAGRRRDDAE